MVANEAFKDYKLLMIANVIRTEASKVCENLGVEYLKTKVVANIKQKLVGPISLHLIGDADLKSDISNAIEFLIKNNYRAESFFKQGSLERACYILIELNKKKMLVAKETVINFRTKRISLTNIRPEILTEIYKFPFLLQKLIVEEVHAVLKRLEEGKCTPDLASAECSYRFFNQYMLSYCYIFYKQLCRTNILMPETWSYFQRTFEESDMEVYQIHGIVEVSVIQKSLAEKAAKKS
ncbi:4325_t:CDS:2 [Gigaspora margarita]|uniref:4325_t:CDS:1 n=1 Tax=Gigaspora margarita TaxID=4874 RepID=A0ABN7UV54_GIGMA|nr:4325_t:CDS:2 [Gigaspora margarita]